MLQFFIDNVWFGLMLAGCVGGAYAIGYGLGFNAAARVANMVFGRMVVNCESWPEKRVLREQLKKARRELGLLGGGHDEQ